MRRVKPNSAFATPSFLPLPFSTMEIWVLLQIRTHERLELFPKYKKNHDVIFQFLTVFIRSKTHINLEPAGFDPEILSQ
jgi:hypothetical protein